jgi:iron complex outermembrane receptor protein
MTTPRPAPLAVALLAALPIAVFAQPADEARRLDTIVVIGETAKAPELDLQGSLDVIGRSEIGYENINDTSALFNKIPGLYIARYNQGLVNSDIAIRGFSGDGETPHVKLLIDGVPMNLHNGFGEMDQLFPTGIESITVFKGTSDPSVGLLAIAGHVRIQTREDVARELRLSYGSYDARELQAYAGFEDGPVTHSYTAGWRQTEGYRDRMDLDKRAFGGRWTLRIDDDTTLRAIVRTASYDGDSPGYLTLAESRANPRQSASYADQDGGDKHTQHGSLHFDQRVGDAFDWSLKAYVNHFERERWVRFSAAQALQNRFDDQDQQGLILSGRWAINPNWTLDGGVDGETQDVIEQRFGTVGQQRVRNTAAVLRNRDFTFEHWGAWTRLGFRDDDRWGANLALRADRIGGDYVQFSATGAPAARDILDFGTIVQPKLNAFVALGEQWQVFANAGRSFQHPLFADAFTAGDRRARDVSINDGWELGATWRPARGAQVRLSVWEQKAKDEFVVVDGTAQNVGETRREGIDLAFDWRIDDRWTLWGSYTTVDSAILRPASNRAAFIGNELRGIPDHTASLGLSVRATDRLTARLHLDRQGDYFVNEANLGGQFGGFTLLHASVEQRFGWGVLALQLNNLTDRYHEYVFDFSENGSNTIHSPGDGRNATLSATIEF